jgi:hypothetical protein
MSKLNKGDLICHKYDSKSIGIIAKVNEATNKARVYWLTMTIPQHFAGSFQIHSLDMIDVLAAKTP